MEQINSIAVVYRLTCGHLQSQTDTSRRHVSERIYCELCESERQIRAVND